MRIFLLLLIGLTARCWADGGVILSRQKIDNLDLTVFAAPAPLRAGPVDISVLVQEAGKPDPVLDAQVEVVWTANPDAPTEWMPACCSMGTGNRMNATLSNSQNKTLYSAMVPIKSAGISHLSVHVKRGDVSAPLSCEINVLPPRPPVLAYWPFLAFPPVLIVGFTIHQRLTRLRKESV
jgi:hypothetical protein